jgi:hypothetical protein
MDATVFDTIPENSDNLFVSMIVHFVTITIICHELFVVCFVLFCFVLFCFVLLSTSSAIQLPIPAQNV